jgi:hypothetical protein
MHSVDEVSVETSKGQNAGGPGAYTGEELRILQKVSTRHGVPVEALLDLVNLEIGFHKMGRRRGLFPAIKEVVSQVAKEEQE